MAAEIRIIGMKQLGKLQQEFTARFPYLGIKFYTKEEMDKAAKGEAIQQLDPKLTIGKVRTVKNNTELKIVGQLGVGALGARMLAFYGLDAQVLYHKAAKRHYTSGAEDKCTLQELNDKFAAEGHDKYAY